MPRGLGFILHGKEDPRVYPGQSLEFYRYIKARSQAPARLVLYPGEKHGNRKGAARLDYSLRLVRWMEHYLQDGGDAPPPPGARLTTPSVSPRASCSWGSVS